MNLKYSRICSIPVLSDFIYTSEFFLVRHNIISTVIASNKTNRFRNKLFQLISKAPSITCNSWKFGRLLAKLQPNSITLDAKCPDFNQLNQEEMYQVMWSITLSSRITKKTESYFRQILPPNIKVQRNIFIPYNDPFSVNCDFVLQTAKTLKKMGHKVTIIPWKNSVQIFNLMRYTQIRREILSGTRFENIITDEDLLLPFTLLPLIIVPQRLHIFFNQITLFFLRKIILRTENPIVWSFDHDDLELIQILKKPSDTKKVTTLYDCVDYFTSLDEKSRINIEKREKELIENVDHVFVNSHILKNKKNRIRKNVPLVAQGFDLESFANETKLTPYESIIIKKITKKKPIIGFVGNVNYRLDFDLLFKLISKNPQWLFVFTDAYQQVLTESSDIQVIKSIQKLKQFKNAYFVPASSNRAYLKAFIQKFDIGMIPYNSSLELNHFSYPMKLFEYFYLGKPVISTPIEELKRFPKYVKIGSTVAEWEKHMKDLLAKPWPESYKHDQRKLAEENCWEKKVSSILKYIIEK